MSNTSTKTTTSTTLSPEQARTLFDHLLPAIVNSRALTRELIRNMSDSKLDLVPIAGGEPLSDLMWYLASAYDVFLNALCDAKFPDLPAKPQPASVQAFLDWDDTRFEQTVQRAQALSDADLLRPLTFGPFTQPAVEFMSMFIGNVAQHTGQLMMSLALVAQERSEVPAASVPAADGELSDEELAGVAGGNVTYIQDNGTAPGPNINVNMVTTNKTAQQMGWLGPNINYGSTMGSTLSNVGSDGSVTGILAGAMSGLGLGQAALGSVALGFYIWCWFAGI
jgi:hypothetical protein